jgi:iron complex transport system substrate-binding protein
VRSGSLHEIKSALILQPGPAALTDGLDALIGIVDAWSAHQTARSLPSGAHTR